MSKNSIDHKDLERLKNALEEHLIWGIASGWHSSMFKELSDKIFERCNVMLSPTTLKRFWGVVNYKGQPSINTLDTLSQFLGFENWRDFKLSEMPEAPVAKPEPETPKAESPRKSLYIALGFCIALFTIMLISSKRVANPTALETVSFSSRPVSNAYPNSIIFDFDLKNIQSDDLHIQQYWDETKTINIDPEQKQATGIYYFPGYFRAKLMVDGQSVKEHDLFLRSNGWLGTIEYEPVPKYFDPIPLEEEGMTYPQELYAEIEESEEPLVTVFHYINDLGNVSGDNFSLRSTLRTTYNEKWAVCQAVRIYLIGTGGAMIIPFSKVGCSSDNSLLLNDVYLSGKKNDLSAFGTDLSNFTDLTINIKDKILKVVINNNEVYQKRYTESMGKLVGLRFKFLGLGEVSSFSLLDQNGGLVSLK